MIKVLFYPSKKRTNKNLKAPIYCRISYNSRRAHDFSTGIFVNPDHWIGDSIINATQESQLDNFILDEMRTRIKAIYLDLELRKKPISAQIVKDIYLNKKASRYTFVELLQKYIDTELLDKEPATIQKHKYIQQNILDFFEATGRKEIIPEEFTIEVAKVLVNWLRNKKNPCAGTHSARHAELCKRVLRWSVQQNYTTINPLEQFRAKRDKPKPIVHLTQEEVEKLLTASFESDALNHATNLFLFQCGSGFSYADLYTEYKITQTDDGIKFFYQQRQKNEEEFCVPLFELSNDILNIYDGRLPYLTNQFYNRLLKEIGALLNIKKRLTTHVARKTFATLKDAEGWSLKSISNMLGHKSQRTTETHYIKTGPKRIIREFKRLKDVG